MTTEANSTDAAAEAMTGSQSVDQPGDRATVTVLDPVRLFSPLVALVAFAVSAPALYRAFVVQSESVSTSLLRLLVSWVLVWGALWVLHLLIGPVSPRAPSTPE